MRGVVVFPEDLVVSYLVIWYVSLLTTMNILFENEV